ncbi:serine/threonine-protein kinase 19 isoform X13 [Vigna umbellata]|uniref:serine/threonine-protein kinase 19 isoform X13 n=1 Tax=Vigna umbellata TaxID=87088 RepID=UPI001F5EBED2|nr:serine/threonine-protein kinase 19 isoform X13 [Vigna umbellata]
MEKFPESSSKGTKRRRDEDSDAGNTSSLEDDLTFTDTSVALRIMRAQFPHIQKSLRRDKVLRLFKLNTGQDDHAVMFLDDYLNQIDRVVKRMEGKKVEEYEVFGWLKTHVPDSKLETSIEHQELCSLLSLGGKVKDSHISVLINAGVLTRQLIDPNMYWFSIPNIGSHLKGIVQGRKEIISLLSRRRYKEMMLSSLEKKRLRTSPLDVRFHLRDLIGSGHLRTDQAPTGLIIRVSKD